MVRTPRLAAVLVMVLAGFVRAQGQRPPEINLPEPRKTGGAPLLEALGNRRSTREFSDKALPDQAVSEVLWAAFGVNRPTSGRRTAPSAVNWQEIDIYAATAKGLYLYNAPAHRLMPLKAGDIRPAIGIQEFPATAPLLLIYVADFSKMTRASDRDKVFYSAADTGFISQNVYLYCASEQLATCVIGLVKRRSLRELLDLREDQRIILAQPVGYPPDPEEDD